MPNWTLWVQLLPAAFAGAFLLMLLFRRECVEFTGVLEAILLTFGSLIQIFARACAFIPNLVLIALNFPPPESDVWQVAFALAIFHQGRTLPTEWAVKGRRWPAVRALIVCALLGASVSYIFGILVPEPNPILTSLFIAILYGFLEFVRYTLLSVAVSRGTSLRFYDEFRRRHLLYTIPYTLIGVFSALTSWSVFGATPALLPFFAVILFSLIGAYILVVEIIFQVRRARGEHSGVPFFQSTRTQTVIVLAASCGICLILVSTEVPYALLDLFRSSCAVIVE